VAPESEGRFITAFTTARHWTLSWAKWIHLTFPSQSLKDPFRIPPSHLCLRLPSSFRLSHQNPVQFSLPSHVCHCPAHLIPLDLICLMKSGEDYNLWSNHSIILILIYIVLQYTVLVPKTQCSWLWVFIARNV
jgi:hypothetical protein